jgi:hypothetical protein
VRRFSERVFDWLLHRRVTSLICAVPLAVALHAESTTFDEPGVFQ